MKCAQVLQPEPKPPPWQCISVHRHFTKTCTTVHEIRPRQSGTIMTKIIVFHDYTHMCAMVSPLGEHAITFETAWQQLQLHQRSPRFASFCLSSEADTTHGINKLRFILHQIVVPSDRLPTLEVGSSFIHYQMKH